MRKSLPYLAMQSIFGDKPECAFSLGAVHSATREDQL
jgi:hypothetical protein